MHQLHPLHYMALKIIKSIHYSCWYTYVHVYGMYMHEQDLRTGTKIVY